MKLELYYNYSIISYTTKDRCFYIFKCLDNSNIRIHNSQDQPVRFTLFENDIQGYKATVYFDSNCMSGHIKAVYNDEIHLITERGTLIVTDSKAILISKFEEPYILIQDDKECRWNINYPIGIRFEPQIDIRSVNDKMFMDIILNITNRSGDSFYLDAKFICMNRQNINQRPPSRSLKFQQESVQSEYTTQSESINDNPIIYEATGLQINDFASVPINRVLVDNYQYTFEFDPNSDKPVIDKHFEFYAPSDIPEGKLTVYNEHYSIRGMIRKLSTGEFFNIKLYQSTILYIESNEFNIVRENKSETVGEVKTEYVVVTANYSGRIFNNGNSDQEVVMSVPLMGKVLSGYDGDIINNKLNIIYNVPKQGSLAYKENFQFRE